MRKKTILYFVDTVFWWTVYALPVIVLVIGSNRHLLDIVNSSSTLLNLFNVLEDSVIYTSLVGLFGTGGVLPVVSSDSILFSFLTWFVVTNLCHIAVDVLLFIPRMAHKFIDVLTSRGVDNG